MNLDVKKEMDLEISQKLYRYHSIAERLTSTDEFGDEQLKKYWKQGYTVIENVLTADEVQSAKDALTDIMMGRVKGPKIQFVRSDKELISEEERKLACRKIHAYVEFEPRLRAITFHDDIMKVIVKILKDKPKLIQDTGLLKPPFGGDEKPWHQDMAYNTLSYDTPIVGVWVALDEAELDNGCIHIIPESHTWGCMPHYAVRDWQICDSSIPVEKDVAVPLKPGGVLFFHGLLYHGTPANYSVKRRRAVQSHFVGASATHLTPKEYKRVYTNKITGAEC